MSVSLSRFASPVPSLVRVACVAALLGASSFGAVHATTPKNTLVQAFAFDDIITMDPGELFEISAGEVAGNTYDRLVRLDPKDPSNVVGDLASSWAVSADGKVFSFELKPNLKFASGNPITADDVVWSLQRAVFMDKNPAFILTQFGLNKDNVKAKVRATGPLKLEFEVDNKYATSFVLNCLTANVAAVLDKKLLLSKEANGDMGAAWLKTGFAGSGPYSLREWRANDLIVLERNNNYHGPKAKLDRIMYRFAKESSAQRLMLEKGDVDVARNLSPQDIAAVKANKNVQVTATPLGTVYYISMNMKNPNLAKPEVREALKHLVDYDGIGNTLIKDIGVIHQHFLPVGLLGAATDKPFKLDIDKAKGLLAKAGLPSGFKVTMDVRSIQPVQGLAESFQQTAKRAGVDIEIIPGDGKQVLTKYRARSHDIFIGQWGADYWDPHTNASTFLMNPDNKDDAKAKPLAWRNAWDIPELSKKADAASMESDSKKRAAAYKAMQAEFVKSSPFIVLFQQIGVGAYRSNVLGYKLGVTSDTNYVFGVTKR